MTRPRVERILELVDAGLGHSGGGDQVSIDPTRCSRQNCKQPSVAGHGFCGPCLAWLRGDEIDDPLDAPPPAVAGPVTCLAPLGVDPVEWEAELVAAIAAQPSYGSQPRHRIEVSVDRLL